MEFTHTRISLKRHVGDYSKVQDVLSCILRGRRFQVSRALRSGKRYLNVGCGPHLEPGFINLDRHWRPGIDLCWDIRKALPLPDGCLDGIYSEHCLEHLDFESCKKAVKAFHRMLKPGGFLRVAVPDAGLYLRCYAEHGGNHQAAFPAVGADERDRDGATAMMVVNRVFRDYGHRYAYDEETLCKLLSEAGFAQPARAGFRRGQCETLLIDTPSRAAESLYVEARK